jgi:hypothetical protein
VIPRKNDKKVVARTPMITAPGIRRITRNTIRKNVKIASRAEGWPRSPRLTGAPGTPRRTRPVSLRPMNARKSPIPTEKLNLSVRGSASASQPRTLSTVRSVKRTPAMKTAPSAIVQGTPIILTTVNAMKAFSPI